MEHIIWQDSYFWTSEDEQDWIEEARANAVDDDEPFDEEKALEWAREVNDYYLDDERANLNISVPNEIIAIADLGLWDGRHSGYHIVENKNISEALYSNCDYCKWYCDDDDFRFTGIHHDGTNHYLYRMRKLDLDDYLWDEFLEKLYNGEEVNVDDYTVSLLPYIREVYGF